MYKIQDMILVIDEYPYLRENIKGLDSIIQTIVDKYKDTSKMKLIICGSYVDTMKALLTNQNSLFGRIDLKPMDYYESKFRKEPLNESVIKEEIMQVDKTGISCYKYGFISRSGFECEKFDDRILISLEDIYK